jgi:nicotinate-nucleotide adenylyltransferase
MGADNLAQFHKWDRWEQIMEMVPVGVLARPDGRMPARVSKAAARYERWRLPARASHMLARSTPPAWCFVNVPMLDISSSEIRASGRW